MGSTTYVQFYVWFAFLSLAVIADIAADERAVLAELYTATNGPTTWSAGCRNGWSGALSHCSGAWFGVGCDVAGRVTSIALTTCGMTGTVPPSLGNLSMLQVVRFLSNQIGGTLPPELGRLEMLHTFSLSNNRFVGTLPPEWSGMRSMQMPTISRNLNITGTLPVVWANISSLRILDVPGNRLSGTLPREWGTAFAQLYRLDLPGNFFEGTLPPEWGNSTIEFLYLYSNRLTGTLPREWGSLRGIRDLSLESNFFSGEIPHEWSLIMPLNGISVSSNCLRLNTSAWYTAAHSRVAFLPQRRLAECRTLSESQSFVSLPHTATRETPTQTLTKTISKNVTPAAEKTNTAEETATARGSQTVALPATLTLTTSQKGANAIYPSVPSVSVLVSGTSFVVLLPAVATSYASVGNFYTSGTSLAASLAGVRIAARIAHCDKSVGTSAAELDADNPPDSTVGSLVADHPLRFRLAVGVGDDRQTWAGAVVGNWCVVALLCPAVLACASYVHGQWLSRGVPAATGPTRRSCLRAGVGGSLALWGALQVPTTAAAVALLVDGGGSGSATAVAVFGVALSLAPVAIAAWTYLLTASWRPALCGDWTIEGRRFETRLQSASPTATWMGRARRAAQPLVEPRGAWTVRPPAATSAVSDVAVRALLDTALFPASWVVVMDSVGGLLQGVVSGLSEIAPCSSLAACAWGLAAVCGALAGASLWRQTRPTAADGGFQRLMASWAFTTAIAAALGRDTIADQLTLAQAGVALAWCCPWITLRIMVWIECSFAYCKSSRSGTFFWVPRDGDTIEAINESVGQERRFVQHELQRLRSLRGGQQLERLIRLICGVNADATASGAALRRGKWSRIHCADAFEHQVD